VRVTARQDYLACRSKRTPGIFAPDVEFSTIIRGAQSHSTYRLRAPLPYDEENSALTDTRHSFTRSTSDRWKLTELAFNKLLSSLSPDREEAANRYELLRQKLIRFCESNNNAAAEDGADEIINRVARRIDEGVVVTNVFSYSYGVAKMVLKELWKDNERTRLLSESLPSAADPDLTLSNSDDARTGCFDSCLERLSKENQKLLIEYYREDRHAKILLRQQLAEQLSIPLNALRIRVHRIRKSLEECVRECVAAALKEEDSLTPVRQ
jgi:DNA-directed RNA polymerase specialized sigma24 family protein